MTYLLLLGCVGLGLFWLAGVAFYLSLFAVGCARSSGEALDAGRGHPPLSDNWRKQPQARC